MKLVPRRRQRELVRRYREACEADHEFFVREPHRTSRERPITAGEADLYRAFGNKVARSARVIVTKDRDGWLNSTIVEADVA